MGKLIGEVGGLVLEAVLHSGGEELLCEVHPCRRDPEAQLFKFLGKKLSSLKTRVVSGILVKIWVLTIVVKEIIVSKDKG